MEIIPAIDIKNGKCVRLFQGDYGRETVYDDNPVIIAQKWEKQGAKILHVIDLDGAKEGVTKNIGIIKKMKGSISIPLQVGGGIRSMASIKELINMGISRIILGTAALEDDKLLNQAIKLFRNRIIISLDANNGVLMENGWTNKSNKKLIPTIKELEKKGIQSIIYTDTTKDGTLTEPNYKEVSSLNENTNMNILIAGGISSIDQIKKLKKINVDGVILGTALYEGKIKIKEANELC